MLKYYKDKHVYMLVLPQTSQPILSVTHITSCLSLYNIDIDMT